MTASDLKEQRLRRTLKEVAERVPVGAGDETFLTRVPPPQVPNPRRVLVGVGAAVVVIAAIVALIAYGPRSSDLNTSNSSNNAASSPPVSTNWVVGAPSGYVALKSATPHILGIQTLQSAGYHRPGLRQAGWVSGVAEDWAPEALAHSGHSYSINLTIHLYIDEFGSKKEAAAYQAKAASRYVKSNGAAFHVDRVKIPGIAQAFVGQVTNPASDQVDPGLTYTVVIFHRGPYVVTLGGGENNSSGQVQHLVEQMAQIQFDRLPH
jgi:hypothetical protein